MNTIEIRELKKKYGRREVLSGIDLKVSGSTCVGILGGNGSGKSTLLSILAGIISADGGSFQAMTDGRTAKVGYVPQGTPLIAELSARDNLSLWYDRKALRQELESGVLRELGIPEFLNIPVRKMSGGMKKRLSIGCAVAGDPDILLMDEPTAALDIPCKNSIYAYISAFCKKGGIVLLSTHDIHEISFCDECHVLQDGKLMEYQYDGDIDRLAGLLR